MKVGDRLRLARQARGLTQEALAREAGMNVTQYNAYERGRSSPSPGTLARLASALGTTAADLQPPALADQAIGERGSRTEITWAELRCDFQNRAAAFFGVSADEISVRVEVI